LKEIESLIQKTKQFLKSARILREPFSMNPEDRAKEEKSQKRTLIEPIHPGNILHGKKLPRWRITSFRWMQ